MGCLGITALVTIVKRKTDVSDAAVLIAKLVPEVAYEAPRGTEGEFWVVKPLDRIRFTHCHPGAAAASTVQIALVRSGQTKTAITFHHEKLRDPEERELMRRH